MEKPSAAEVEHPPDSISDNSPARAESVQLSGTGTARKRRNDVESVFALGLIENSVRGLV